MKPVRSLLIVVGVFALVGGVALALAFTPSVQRWLVLRSAARPGVQLRIDSLSVGPASCTLRGLQFEQHGLRIGCDRLEADYSLVHLLFGGHLELGRLDASGVTVDTSRLSRNRVLAGVVAAPAALVQSRLPLDVVVGELRIVGRALVPGAPGRPAVKADFKINGGHFAPGRDGALHLEARLVDPAPGARVAELAVQAGLQIKQSLARSFDRVDLTAVVDASGPGISGRPQLKVAAELARTAAGENYLVHVDTLANGQAGDILVLKVRHPPGAKEFTGDWLLTLRSAQIEPFVIGGALPRFDAHGAGTFALDSAGKALSLRGSIGAAVGELETLRPALRALGTVNLKGEFDVAADSGGVQLNKLAVSLAGAQPVLDLQASAAAAFNLKERRFELAAPLAGGSGAAGPDEIVRLRLTGLPLAWIRPFVTVADVSGGVIKGEIVLTSGDGQRLRAQTVTPLRANEVTVVRGGRTLLAQAALGLDAEAELLPAGVQIGLRSLTVTTPAGDSVQAKGQVTTSTGPGRPLMVAGDFTADLPGLPARWLPAGHLRARGAADFTLQPGRIDFRHLTFEAVDDKGQRLAGLSLTQAFGLDLVRLAADTGPSEVELLRASIGRLPLGLFVRPRAGFTLAGTTTPDEFSLNAQGDRLSLKARSPLLLEDVILTRGASRWLDRMTLEFSPRIDVAGGMVSRVASGGALVRDAAGAPLAKFNAEIVRTAGAAPRASLSFNVDLPTLVAEPMFARAEALAAGQASGEIRAAALGGGDVQVEARATLNGLVARDGAQTLPVANVSVRTLLQSDGHFSLQAPVLLDSAGQRSDFNFAAEGARQGGVTTFSARLTGGHIELGDAMLLASAAGEPLGSEDPESRGAQNRALSPPPADERAFWDGFAGEIQLDLKEVARGSDWTVSKLSGQVALKPDQVALTKLSADFGGGSKFSAQGSLTFEPGLNPYRCSGSLGLTDFDLGRFFRALDPDREPTVDGLGTVKASFDGQGLTLDDTLDRVRGRFELTSGKGTFHGLKRAGERLSLASKAVRWSAALGSFLRTGRVKQAAEKVAGSSYYVDQLALLLAGFNYDEFSLKLARDDSLNLKIEEMNLVSPEVRLFGRGEVTYVAGQALLNQPLSLALDFSSRGRVEQLLGKLHDLDGARDDLDYARTKEPVVIGGTLARPDPVKYYSALLAAKVTD